jgi:hypothetical protein
MMYYKGQNGKWIILWRQQTYDVSVPELFTDKKKVKLSRYTPCWRLGGEEVLLLFILNFGTRWG